MITADIIMNSLSLSQITKQDDNVQEIEAVTKENDELKEVLSAVQTDLQDKRAVRIIIIIIIITIIIITVRK